MSIEDIKKDLAKLSADTTSWQKAERWTSLWKKERAKRYAVETLLKSAHAYARIVEEQSNDVDKRASVVFTRAQFEDLLSLLEGKED